MNEKNELIQKLEAISALYKKEQYIKTKMRDYIAEDCYERTIFVPPFPIKDCDDEVRKKWEKAIDHESDRAMEFAEQVHRQVLAPKEPEKLKLIEFRAPINRQLKEKQEKFKNKSYLGIGLAGFFLLSSLTPLFNGDFSWVLLLMLAVAIYGGRSYASNRKKYKEALQEEENENALALQEHNRLQEEKKAKYAEMMKEHENACVKYEAVLGKFLEDYKVWREIYLQMVAEEDRIAKKLEEDRLAAVQKMEESEYKPVLQEMAAVNDLVTTNYLPSLDVIIDLLKSGRADDLKEAINLYEDMVYRERQLQLQREQEEQRRYEEEQRRADEERRYQEEMRFREDQERQRRIEAEQQRKEDERRTKDRERQEREAAKRVESDAKIRCHYCKNYYNCGVRTNPPLNCGAFNPGTTHQI